MQKLTPRLGASAVAAAHRFVSIRLKSRPASRKLAGAVDENVALISDAQTRWLASRDERVAATAELAYLDTLLDAAVGSIAREVLVLTGGDRNDARYRKLFPEAPSHAMRGVGNASQDQFVLGLVSRLEEETDLASLKPHAKRIRRAQDDLAAARKRRDELYVAETKAAADLAIVLEDACRAYNQVYPRLQLLFAADTALVESFFPAIRRGRGATDEDTDPTIEAPTGGTPIVEPITPSS